MSFQKFTITTDRNVTYTLHKQVISKTKIISINVVLLIMIISLVHLRLNYNKILSTLSIAISTFIWYTWVSNCIHFSWRNVESHPSSQLLCQWQILDASVGLLLLSSSVLTNVFELTALCRPDTCFLFHMSFWLIIKLF